MFYIINTKTKEIRSKHRTYGSALKWYVNNATVFHTPATTEDVRRCLPIPIKKGEPMTRNHDMIMETKAEYKGKPINSFSDALKMSILTNAGHFAPTDLVKKHIYHKSLTK